jgi:uncharacterized membrane protein YdbT with pleckstrin-like domain
MADIIVRPTMKFIKAGYFGVLLFIALVFVICATNGWSFLIPACFLVLFVWPLERHVKNKTVKIAITEDKLRYQRGLLSKTVETIQLVKVQDVRVQQSFAQRLLRVGSIEIETAGSDSRLTVLDIDHPQAIADIIMSRSQHQGSGPSGHGASL